MDFFSPKVSVILAAIIGALWRVYRVDSEAKTTRGKVIDGIIIYVISFMCALLFVGPVMMFLAIPMAYAAIVALAIAVLADAIISSFLKSFQKVDILEYLRNKFGGGK